MAKSSSRSSGNKRGSGNSKGGSGRAQAGAAQTTTDHEQIRQWAEARGAKPSCVRGTGGGGDTGMIRLDFPGYSGGDSLQEISWDEWFEQFDENNLALLIQETTKEGEPSNFNKLVSRETADGKSAGRSGGAGGRSGGGARGGASSRAGATARSGGAAKSGGARKSASSLRGGAGRSGKAGVAAKAKPTKSGAAGKSSGARKGGATARRGTAGTKSKAGGRGK